MTHKIQQVKNTKSKLWQPLKLRQIGVFTNKLHTSVCNINVTECAFILSHSVPAKMSIFTC